MIEEDGVLPEGLDKWWSKYACVPETGDPRNSMPPSDNPIL